MKKKNKSKLTQWIMLIVGAILMTSSYLIYKFNGVMPFLDQIHSEIFGAGIVLFLVGLIWILFRIRLD